jgi:RNA polymerase sigma-70 factor (ECF subfamily)
VTTWVDGGGKVHGAAIHPVQGSKRVAKQIIASIRQMEMGIHTGIEMVNGEPALVARAEDYTLAVISAGIWHGKIHELWIVGNPDKLKHV